MIAVLDASAAVDLVTDDDLAPRVRQVIAAARLQAPAIVDLEVSSALARLERAQILTADQVTGALSDWLRFPVKRVQPRRLAAAAFAKRSNVSIAAAFYVALAEFLNAPLITTDGRLARAPLPNVTVTYIN